MMKDSATNITPRFDLGEPPILFAKKRVEHNGSPTQHLVSLRFLDSAENTQPVVSRKSAHIPRFCINKPDLACDPKIALWNDWMTAEVPSHTGFEPSGK